MKIILTRHCETDWNKEGRLQGRTDISLNETGRMQAAQLAHNLTQLFQSCAPLLIVSSDLSRALETSQIIARHFLEIPVVPDPHFQECSFGNLEGKTNDELNTLHGSEMIRLIREEYHSYDFRPFGGESRNEVFSRHIEGLQQLYRRYASSSALLIVGHGKGLNTLLAGLGRMPDLSRGKFHILDVSDDLLTIQQGLVNLSPRNI